MSLVDTNVWLALALSAHVHHEVCRTWLDSIADAPTIFFCRATQSSFLRLLTNAAVLAPYGNPPLTNREAWAVYEKLAADERIAFRADEPAGLESTWRDLAVRDTASPKLWMDSYLAAFVLAEAGRLVTTDAGFSQFVGLDLVLLGRDTDISGSR